MRRPWLGTVAPAATAALLVTAALAACSTTTDGTPAARARSVTHSAATAFPSVVAGAGQTAVPVDMQRAAAHTTLGEAGHVDLCSTATFGPWRHGIRLTTENVEPVGQCSYDANTHSGIFPVTAYATSLAEADYLGTPTIVSRAHGHVIEAVDDGSAQRCTRVVRFTDLAIVVESFAGASVTRHDSCGGVDVAVHLFATNDTAARYTQLPVPDVGIASVDFCLALPAARAAAVLGVATASTTGSDFDTVCTWRSGQHELDAQAALTSAGYELPDPNVRLGGHELIANCTAPTRCEVDAAQPGVPAARRIPLLRVTAYDNSSSARTARTRLAAERAAVAILDAAKLS